MKHLFVPILILLFSYTSIAQQRDDVVLVDKAVPKPATTDTVVANWNTSQPGYDRLTMQAKDFYYWANYSRTNPKRFWDSVLVPVLATFPNLKSSYSESLQADLYSSQQLPLLKLNANLITTAQAHATDIGTKKGNPGHVSTDGRSFVDRIKAVGIRKCGGENVSLGDMDPILSLVLLYIDYDVANLGHRKALLNANYMETGVGVSAYGNEQNMLFIVQDFSCLQQ